MARRGVNAGHNRGRRETESQRETSRLRREAFRNAHIEPRERFAYTMPANERLNVYEMAAELGLSIDDDEIG